MTSPHESDRAELFGYEAADSILKAEMAEARGELAYAAQLRRLAGRYRRYQAELHETGRKVFLGSQIENTGHRHERIEVVVVKAFSAVERAERLAVSA